MQVSALFYAGIFFVSSTFKNYLPLTPSKNTLMNNQILSNHIRLLRTAKGYSQDGFAKLCKLTQSQISKVERNGYKNGLIPKNILETISNALEISTDALAAYGNQKDNNFNLSLSSLSTDERKLYDALDLDKDLLEQLMSTMSMLMKLNDSYRIRLQECEQGKK